MKLRTRNRLGMNVNSFLGMILNNPKINTFNKNDEDNQNKPQTINSSFKNNVDKNISSINTKITISNDRFNSKSNKNIYHALSIPKNNIIMRKKSYFQGN